MTEAALVQDLFRRLAQGSSAIGEAQRFNALGIPTTRYHGNGTARKAGKRWYPVRIAQIIANTAYKGLHTYQSAYGAIERQVPPLVESALWEQANAQLQRNRKLPKRNRTREYLLCGLITCGRCGASYVGQIVTRPSGKLNVYYRCGNRGTPIHPAREDRCLSKIVDATWLEQTVWEDCRAFILNPGEALGEAQRQLQERLRQTAHMDQERVASLHALAEKAHERERIMTLFRRGRLNLAEAETQLDDIAREEADLRQQCSAIDAQKALADTYAAYLTGASRMLQRLQERLTEVEQTDAQTTKRQVVEMLVQDIRIDTHDGAPRGSTPCTVTVRYAFIPERVAVNGRARTVTL